MASIEIGQLQSTCTFVMVRGEPPQTVRGGAKSLRAWLFLWHRASDKRGSVPWYDEPLVPPFFMPYCSLKNTDPAIILLLTSPPLAPLFRFLSSVSPGLLLQIGRFGTFSFGTTTPIQVGQRTRRKSTPSATFFALCWVRCEMRCRFASLCPVQAPVGRIGADAAQYDVGF